MRAPRPLAALLAVLLAAAPVSAGGPAQPEAMQFEPVDTSDLVSLTTGDFAYTLPFFEVPGPAGGYPLVLSYHAGIGPNQEATWVGLGWTLNPGAVNRAVNGYPDDYNADNVRTKYTAEASGWGANIGLGWGPVGLNMAYDSYTGSVGVTVLAKALGVNVSAGTSGLGIGGGIGKGFQLSADVGFDGNVSAGGGYGKHLGGNVVGQLGLSAGTQGVSLGADAGYSDGKENGLYVSGVGTGVSLSSQGFGANFRTAGVGISGSAGGASSGKTSSRGFQLPRIPIGGGWITGGFSEWQWKLDDTFDEPSYGFLYMGAAVNTNASGYTRKFEQHKQDDEFYPAPDGYVVSAQGVGGSFEPLPSTTLRMYARREEREKGLVDSHSNTSPASFRFRFTNDPGPNYSVKEYSGGAEVAKMIVPSRPYSRKVEPLYTDGTTGVGGKLKGFRVSELDGKVYEFTQPVMSLASYSKTTRPSENSSSSPSVAETEMTQPHATSWLLTAVKGPDYVDRGAGGYDAADWGYWVKFSYAYSTFPQVWRSPMVGTDAGVDPEVKLSAYSTGAREHAVLTQVETATHVVLFATSAAKDRYPIRSSAADVKVESQGTNYRVGASATTTFKFSGNLKAAIEGRKASAPNNTLIQPVNSPGNFSNCIPPLAASKVTAVSYDPSDHVTSVTVQPSTFGTTIQQCGSEVRAQILASDLVPSGTGTGHASVKLDAVRLYSKADPAVSVTSGVWTAGVAAVSVQEAILSYNYGLSGNTPGSVATAADGADRGKLTLQTVDLRGQGGARVMPPYAFEYGKNDGPGGTLNPNWTPFGWDRWGSYRDGSGTDYGKFKHLTPQTRDRANRAAAWSLTAIETPTGGRIEVDHESDDYLFASKVVEPVHSTAPTTVTGSSSGSTTVTVGSASGMAVGGLVTIEQTAKFTNGTADIVADVGTRRVTAISGTTLTLHEPIALSTTVPPYPPYDAQGTTISYKARYNGAVTFGGGTRVREIRSTNGPDTYRTRYEYRGSVPNPDDGAVSSGIASSLPSTYGDWNSAYSRANYKDLYLNYGRPAPEVLYSQVDVYNTDGTASGSLGASTPLNGKTRYQFYTAYDHPYKLNRTVVWNSSTSTTTADITVDDRTGIYGMPKGVTTYEQVGSGFRKVKVAESRYAYSTDLGGVANLYVKGGLQPGSGTRPGAIDEKTYYNNQFKNSQNQDRTRTGSFKRTRHNVYKTGDLVTEYYYASGAATTPSGSVAVETKSFEYDVYTGAQTATAKTTAEGGLVVERTVPAYWKYGDLEGKSMLSQTAQTFVYRSPALTLSGLLSYSFPSDQIQASSVTTWSNRFDLDGNGSVDADEQKAWRVNDTYVYDKVRDNSTWANFDAWDEAATPPANVVRKPYPQVSDSSPWRMTSNVTAYDVYGHATEAMSPDGAYDATLYGYGRWLPTATVARARQNQVAYLDFDGTVAAKNGTSTATARTGAGATLAAQVPSGGTAGNTYAVTLAPAAYRISFWTRKGTASTSSQASVKVTGSGVTTATVSGTPGDGSWTYVDGTFTVPGTVPVVVTLTLSTAGTGSANHVIDDVLVAPVGALASTFAYDYRSGRVTSITDANGVTAFFEYDTAGRLTKTRNQDGQIVARNRYFVPVLDLAPSIVAGNATTFTALANPDVTRYEWEVAGAAAVSSTSNVYSWTASGTGYKPVAVRMYDAANRLVASRRDQIRVDGPVSVTVGVTKAETSPLYEVSSITAGGSGQFSYAWSQRSSPTASWSAIPGETGTSFYGECLPTTQGTSRYYKIDVRDLQTNQTATANTEVYCPPSDGTFFPTQN